MILRLLTHLAIPVLTLASSGCDSWYEYRITGTITDRHGSPASGVYVVSSLAQERLLGPPRLERTVMVAPAMIGTEEGAILVDVTSPDGKFSSDVLGSFVRSAFSPPAPKLDEVRVYLWQDRWIETRIDTEQ